MANYAKLAGVNMYLLKMHMGLDRTNPQTPKRRLVNDIPEIGTGTLRNHPLRNQLASALVMFPGKHPNLAFDSIV